MVSEFAGLSAKYKCRPLVQKRSIKPGSLRAQVMEYWPSPPPRRWLCRFWLELDSLRSGSPGFAVRSNGSSEGPASGLGTDRSLLALPVSCFPSGNVYGIFHTTGKKSSHPRRLQSRWSTDAHESTWQDDAVGNPCLHAPALRGLCVLPALLRYH